MKKSYIKKMTFLVIASVFFCSSNFSFANAKEPIMQEKYTIEEQKIKRAQFIWTACIEELRKDNILSDNDVKNIHKYLNESMPSNKKELTLKRYEREKKALQVHNVDKMIENKIITFEQGKALRKMLNKYDLSNLEI